uniref:Uncharacterized protein n=1 Tax=Neogobius melanostomus TaxID=47308 RepID=A0A8C6UNP8_9GOBI
LWPGWIMVALLEPKPFFLDTRLVSFNGSRPFPWLNLCFSVADIDECASSPCVSNTTCTNYGGGFRCECLTGFKPTDGINPPASNNPCTGAVTITHSHSDNSCISYSLSCVFYKDVDECLAGPCGGNEICLNNLGSFACECATGFANVTGGTKPPCQGKATRELTHVDECLEDVCGEYEICLNNPGSFACKCATGFENVTGGTKPPCQGKIHSDTDECSKTPDICGFLGVCTNVLGLFLCSCLEGSYPNTGVLWTMGVTYCRGTMSLSYKCANRYVMLDFGHSLMIIVEVSKLCWGLLPQLLPESGLVNCVYWNISTQQLMDLLSGGGDEDAEAYSGEWSEEGCWVSHTNESYTVCSCSHLSTFALILQTGEVFCSVTSFILQICVIIGLFFFALAILTFLLCSWNPKINNTARLHLCLNLGLILILIPSQQACKAMAGILHFVVVASFVWMLLEAVQLYILVRRLNKVQVIKRDGFPPLVLLLIGYGVPLVIVGVSASVYHPGYGSNAICENKCLCFQLNFLLFGATLWSLRTTLANMRSGASDSKDTKLVLFKIVAQFVILGCTWILGLYQSNLFFQILFIVLNSQQGTFLYIVHCVLNKEVTALHH